MALTIKNIDEKSLMRHDKDSILKAMRFLYTYNKSEEYRNNLKTIIEYIEDVTQLMGRYKEIAESSSKTLTQVAKKMDGLLKLQPQDHKKKEE